jgi:hypothetical protein
MAPPLRSVSGPRKGMLSGRLAGGIDHCASAPTGVFPSGPGDIRSSIDPPRLAAQTGGLGVWAEPARGQNGPGVGQG